MWCSGRKERLSVTASREHDPALTYCGKKRPCRCYIFHWSQYPFTFGKKHWQSGCSSLSADRKIDKDHDLRLDAVVIQDP